ncbi:RnfH family protein [Alginatibacterium sediminis]|uniref:UPF0125 protein DBZ36_13775 n=1 Tax=Alginatibacterium sediminis TaxID=2164068 RepID=A0A420E9Z8_9ALTE|nr:RnfH family protein [Alginatibacterium sediminis]RKF17506.1 RnfH family protein [Alginatibacterium sediminis]
MSDLIPIEVVYGDDQRQVLLELEVEKGCSIQEAIVLSNIQEHFEQIDPATASVGIFSRAAKLDQVLKSGDRIEIYRPLIADPKELRKIRAERAKALGNADKVTGGRPQVKVQAKIAE